MVVLAELVVVAFHQLLNSKKNDGFDWFIGFGLLIAWMLSLYAMLCAFHV